MASLVGNASESLTRHGRTPVAESMLAREDRWPFDWMLKTGVRAYMNSPISRQKQNKVWTGWLMLLLLCVAFLLTRINILLAPPFPNTSDVSIYADYMW